MWKCYFYFRNMSIKVSIKLYNIALTGIMSMISVDNSCKRVFTVYWIKLRSKSYPWLNIIFTSLSVKDVKEISTWSWLLLFLNMIKDMRSDVDDIFLSKVILTLSSIPFFTESNFDLCWFGQNLQKLFLHQLIWHQFIILG